MDRFSGGKVMMAAVMRYPQCRAHPQQGRQFVSVCFYIVKSLRKNTSIATARSTARYRAAAQVANQGHQSGLARHMWVPPCWDGYDKNLSSCQNNWHNMANCCGLGVDTKAICLSKHPTAPLRLCEMLMRARSPFLEIKHAQQYWSSGPPFDRCRGAGPVRAQQNFVDGEVGKGITAFKKRASTTATKEIEETMSDEVKDVTPTKTQSLL
jgi:hypothetical protein